jgi:Prenyltransferase and squalene oxidase repeat
MSALTLTEIRQTADWIASVQLPDGMVPWYRGGHADPWNHVEATMALAAGGCWAEAERAFEWLASRQLPDGSWCASHVPGGVLEPHRDPNACAYVATGVWWCAQLSQSTSLLEAMWPVVKRAISWCLIHQRPGGEIPWSVDPDGVSASFALLAASSSLRHSLACAARAAEALGHEPEACSWRLAAARVGHALVATPGAFVSKERWAMDWYYPVLTGAVVGDAARQRMRSRWLELVVPGLGVRCVAENLWVTAAESAECAMAAARAGMPAEAGELLGWGRHLRDGDGGYWTGCVHPECVRFPGDQKSTYSAAAVVIADHVLDRRSPAAAIFSDDRPGDEAYNAGSPSASTPASSSLAARRPEPMHAGTPTPP